MALAASKSNRPFLSPVPRQLPKSQVDWDQVANALQGWELSLCAPKWIAPTLLNGWVYYGSPFEPPGYYMDVAGRVYIRGLVKSGTLTAPIFVLPSAYIPAYTAIVPAISVDALAEVRIEGIGDSNPGAVAVTSGGNNNWVSLSNISFGTTP